MLRASQAGQLLSMRGLLDTIKRILPLPPPLSTAPSSPSPPVPLPESRLGPGHAPPVPPQTTAWLPPQQLLDDPSLDSMAHLCELLRLDKTKLVGRFDDWSMRVEQWVQSCWAQAMPGGSNAEEEAAGAAGAAGESNIVPMDDGTGTIGKHVDFHGDVSLHFEFPSERGSTGEAQQQAANQQQAHQPADGAVRLQAPPRQTSGVSSSSSHLPPRSSSSSQAKLAFLLASLDRFSQAAILTAQLPGAFTTAAGQQLVEVHLSQAALRDLSYAPERVESWRQLAELYDMVRGEGGGEGREAEGAEGLVRRASCMGRRGW